MNRLTWSILLSLHIPRRNSEVFVPEVYRGMAASIVPFPRLGQRYVLEEQLSFVFRQKPTDLVQTLPLHFLSLTQC